MPKARILSHQIDKDSIETLDQKDGLFNPVKVEDVRTFDSVSQDAMEERAIDRLRKFARYARDKGVVKGENSFEAYCELSNRYIYNSIRNGKGAIGTDIIARIVDKFPELNVKWLCTGKGNMIETDIDANVNYKAAYEGAMMQIEALHKIIEENKRR